MTSNVKIVLGFAQAVSVAFLVAFLVAQTPAHSAEPDNGDKKTASSTPEVKTPAVSATAAPKKAAPKSGSAAKGVYKLPRPPKNFSPATLTIDEPIYEWGSVVRGSVVKHTFKVTNTGGSPLIIERVKPQCGCTAVDQPKEPVAAGASVDLTLSVDTKKFKGSLKKTAQIFSNGSAKPVVLTMQGSVETVFAFEPENPKIEVVRGSDAPPFKLTMRRVGSQAAKVLEVTSQSTVLSPKLTETEPGQVYTVDMNVELAENNKRNYFSETISAKIETDGLQIDIPTRVTIVVKDRIDLNPKSAYFPRKETDKLKTPDSEPLSKTIAIKSLGGSSHSFKILEVKSPSETFTTTTETVTEGKEYKINVTLSKIPEENRRTVRDLIVIKTDDPSQPELKVTAMAIFGK